MTYLFTVEDTFQIENRGLIVGPGIPRNSNIPAIPKGARIQLQKPDGSIIDTHVHEIRMIRYMPDTPPEKRTTPIGLSKDFLKEDIPAGTEVFLI